MLEGKVGGAGDVILHNTWLGFREACFLSEQMLQLMKPLGALQVNPSDSPSATSGQPLLQDPGLSIPAFLQSIPRTPPSWA